jgi:gliding motility-associated-like protein
VQGGPGSYLFDWQPKAGLSDPASLTPIAAPALTTTYTLTVEAGVCTLLDTVRVEVALQPEVWLQTQAAAQCGTEPTTLTAFSNRPEHQFSWAPATGLTATTGPSVAAQPTEPTTYTVTATNALGCTATATVSVTPNGILPVAAFDLTQPTNCASTRVSFSDRSQNAIAWAWDFGDGSPVVNTPSPVHAYPAPGQYLVSLTVVSESGCTSTFAAPTPVLISTGLEARFEASLRPNADSLVLDQSRVAFRDASLGAIVAWFWDFGDGHHAAEPAPVHTYRAAGDYTVTLTVTDAAGCVDTAMSGVYKIREPLLRYPNVFTPNGDGVNDTWKPIYDGPRTYTYTLTDRWGIVLYTGNQDSRGWNGQNPDGTEAMNGVYFYIVKLDDRTYSGSLTLLRD